MAEVASESPGAACSESPVTRSATELEPTVIAGDRALHIDPMPVPPPKKEAIELCGWTGKSREAWLRGEVQPTTAEVLRIVMERIDRYIELPGEDTGDARGYGSTLALWVMLSYCYPTFPAVPYLYLAGPAGSGKTRTMDVIARMVFRPMLSSNATGPTLFRSLHSRGGSMIGQRRNDSFAIYCMVGRSKTRRSCTRRQLPLPRSRIVTPNDGNRCCELRC